MATIEQLAEQLYAYFDRDEPFSPLPEDEYRQFDTLITEALRISPENPLLWFWKGRAHQFFSNEGTIPLPKRDYEWAEDAYQRAIQFDPKNATACLMLMHLYWQGNVLDALVNYIRTLPTGDIIGRGES